MGFFNIKNWLAEKPEKKIYKIQKVIDQLNEALDIIAKSEKRYQDDAAAQLEQASEFGGRLASIYMERKEMSDEAADYYASMRPPFLEYLVLFESLKKREIEALQHGALTRQKTRRFCIFF